MKLARRSPIWKPNADDEQNRRISFQKGLTKWAMACKKCGIWYESKDGKGGNEYLRQGREDGPQIERLVKQEPERRRKQPKNYLWSSIRVLKKVIT